MLKKILGVGLIATLSFSMTGKEVMQKQKKLQSTDTEQSIEIMVLVDEDGTKEKRGVKRYISKNNAKNLTNSSIIFMKPADIKGTALLDKEISKDNENQWVYLPSLKKLQRIAQGSKKNYFMGTDFTYEDLSGDKIENYKYTLLRTEPLKVTKNDKSENCYVIKAVPIKAHYPKTAYGKKIIWVTADHFYTKKIEFYSKRGKLIKTEVSWDFVNPKGTIYRPIKGIMNNFKEHHKTFVLVRKLLINDPIPKKIFTQRYYLNEEHMVGN